MITQRDAISQEVASVSPSTESNKECWSTQYTRIQYRVIRRRRRRSTNRDQSDRLNCFTRFFNSWFDILSRRAADGEGQKRTHGDSLLIFPSPPRRRLF